MCLVVGIERQTPSAKNFGDDVFRTWKIIWTWDMESKKLNMAMGFPISKTGCIGTEEEEELEFQGKMLSLVLDYLS